MVFASIEFLTLFLPLFFVAYLLTPTSGRNLVLLLASWVFYGWWKPIFLLLLWGVTIVGYVCGKAIEAAETEAHKRRLLIIGVLINLACLGWFKYANLLIGTTNGGLALLNAGQIPWDPIILPIGLSFYILHALSYLIDIWRRIVKAEPSFIAFGVYIAMFSQLVAGPVIRYRWVDKELAKRSLDFSGFSAGARRFMIGFAMKVLIADSLAPLVDATFTLNQPSLADAWLGSSAYALQLYFDFAGYSAMAIGLGLMIGFHFPENFDNPYLSTSIQEFWRRWHISLSSWLRDYLYIPLGGNRIGTLRTYFNLIATMAIGGLWHGASWTFVAWGLLHGLALAVERLSGNRVANLPTVLAYPLTMGVVLISWTLFRANDWATAETMLLGQFGLQGIGLSDQLHVAIHPVIALWFMVGLAAVWWPAIAARLPNPLTTPPHVWRMLWPVLAFLYALAVLEGHETVPFLYFQF
jgi:alginate O-acetyltransferase complex protein AlgI